jgi:phosphoribosylamine--glycine ligase
MKVLVVGGGGREHALAWKLAQSPKVQTVFVAPGNAGTALDRRLQNVKVSGVAELREWAQAKRIDLTVVGPEGPLAAGIVDEFRAHGLRIFGPKRAAARLESSKAFSKAFMQRHNIPTAAFRTFTEVAEARAFIDSVGAPIVVKADGLAAGKGVVVATTVQMAYEAVEFMLAPEAEGNKLGVVHNVGADGQAQARVVIEEFLPGEEASFIVMVDGRNVVALASSQDHKRLQDGDQGPNTGGMGAYSPAPVVTPQVHAKAMREIILPTVRGMEADGIPYTGFLYAGLMVSPSGQVKTLEFNCRLGDPETQPILMRMKSDLVDVLMAATDPSGGKLDQIDIQWDRRTALGYVMAAHGYPLSPRKGDLITGLPAPADDAAVFHAGTSVPEIAPGQGARTPDVSVSGGRVLCVTALADSVKAAQQRAYEFGKGIQFAGMQFRTDIGWRALKR